MLMLVLLWFPTVKTVTDCGGALGAVVGKGKKTELTRLYFILEKGITFNHKLTLDFELNMHSCSTYQITDYALLSCH